MTESIKQAIHRAYTDNTALANACSLEGMTEDSAQAEQARRQIVEILPLKTQRSYTVHGLVVALYAVDKDGRYVRRSQTAALASVGAA